MEINRYVALVPELSCSDFSASVDFYTRILGFRIMFGRPENEFAYLALGDAQLMLEQANETWKTAELRKPFGRGINFQFNIEDAQGLSEQIVGYGVPLFAELETSWYRMDDTERGLFQFLVLDPDGYLLRFSEHIGDRAVG